MKSIAILGVCLVLALGITGCDDDDTLQDSTALGLNEINAIAQGTTTALNAVQTLAAAAFTTFSSASSTGGNGEEECENVSIKICDNATISRTRLCNDLATECDVDAECVVPCQLDCAEECKGDKECEAECQSGCEVETCDFRLAGGSAELCEFSITFSECEVGGIELDGSVTAFGKTGILILDLTAANIGTLDGNVLIVPANQLGGPCFDIGYGGLMFTSGGLQLELSSPDFVVNQPFASLQQCVGGFPAGVGGGAGGELTVVNVDFNSLLDWEFNGNNLAPFAVDDLAGTELANCTFDFEQDTVVPALDSSGLCPAVVPGPA
jgi:hypothetical protein